MSFGSVLARLTAPLVDVPERRDVEALVDGTGTVERCWIGRRFVPGIETGQHMRVTGGVGLRKGRPLMFNPRYELLAGPPGRALEVKHA